MEFKVWLCHKKKKFFEDLTSTESHELFDKFVKDWNRYGRGEGQGLDCSCCYRSV